MGFASGPYRRMYRALRKANRPPHPHHRPKTSDDPQGHAPPDPHRPTLEATHRWHRRRLRQPWLPRLVYFLIATAAVALILRLLMAL